MLPSIHPTPKRGWANSTAPSAVIESALKLLKSEYLESAYQQANSQIDPDWEVTANDGLSDRT